MAEGAGGAGAIVQAGNQGNIPLQCPKLTATTYTSWSIMVESILQAYGLWEAIDPVTGGAVEARKNLMARSFVFQTLPKDVLLQVSKHKLSARIAAIQGWVTSLGSFHLGKRRQNRELRVGKADNIGGRWGRMLQYALL
ncbi:hypothetical protein E3N88_30572 [Mikania micrantha]|uniref:DUF4219 domain-containing protein n=1 Tax=Mikania micrantha TaxID=192012 RepID=A0A5N6MMK3_9ASTR|nr:hypothetical protein E3N88_30572 [Mikania micrantha]